jgi:murein DD-endopeptidase MepM/ murein hydrolase activator NlpD
VGKNTIQIRPVDPNNREYSDSKAQKVTVTVKKPSSEYIGKNRYADHSKAINAYSDIGMTNYVGSFAAGQMIYVENRLTTLDGNVIAETGGAFGYSKTYVRASDLREAAPITVGWQYPLNSARCSWRDGGNNWSWGSRNTAKSGARQYHNALDLTSNNANVYAATSGKVVASGTNSANGKYIVLETSLSGKKIYLFHAHLSAISVSKGMTVTKGQKIGVMGNTGSSSAGTHLHFSIADTLRSSGDYVGYTTKFNGNKVVYGGITFYNPKYIIDYGKLPN